MNRIDDDGCLHLDRETTIELITMLRDLCVVVDEDGRGGSCMNPDFSGRWWVGCYPSRYEAGRLARKLGLDQEGVAPRANSRNCAMDGER